MKVFGLVAVIVALLLLVLMLAVGGEHGPGRHLSSGSGAGTTVVAAGTGTDILGRVITEELHTTLPASFVIDNRAGASGQIAAELAATHA